MVGVGLIRTLIYSVLLTGAIAFVPMVKLPWSFSAKVCLPMTDPSYDPLGNLALDDVSEEWRQGGFGVETLYCKRGCCGDNRNPMCCEEKNEVEQSQFETYKLVSIVAAGIGGLCIIAAIVLCALKKYLKKRRLIRDANVLNRTNNMKDLSKGGKTDKYSKKSETDKRSKKLFKSSKKAPVIQVEPKPVDPLRPVFIPSIPPVDTKTETVPQSDAKGKDDNLPIYDSLKVSDFLTSPPTRAVGNLPVFLPTKPDVSPASSIPGPTMALGGTSSTAMAPFPVPNFTKPSVFSTPLAGDPVVYSGPVVAPSPAKYAPLSASTSLSSSEPRAQSSAQRGSMSSQSSSPPNIPWDDEDLLLYFSDSFKG